MKANELCPAPHLEAAVKIGGTGKMKPCRRLNEAVHVALALRGAYVAFAAAAIF